MRGSNVWRFVALIAVCLAAVSAAAKASNKAALAVNVTARLNTANFTIQTATTSKVVVWEGTDTQNMQPWHGDTPASNRSFKLAPLAPNTTYFYKVTATSNKGVVSSASGQFSTTQWDGQPTLAVQNGKLYLNKVRFYPIMAMAFNECPSQQVVGDDTSMGVNILYHSTWYGCPDANHDIRWLAADELHGLLNNQVGWIQAGPRVGINPTQPPSWDSLPELINLQGAFQIEGSPIHQVGTVVGNLPNLYSCDGPGNAGTKLYQGLATEADDHPVVFDSFLTNVIGTNPTCLTAQRMTALFWTPVLAGADGAEYQTQQYALPEDGIIVNNDVQAVAGLQAKHLDTLYPVIFGGKASTATSSSAVVKVRGWQWGGNTYVLALNTGGQPATTKLKVGGSSQNAKVLWQSRNVSTTKGIIADRIGAYGLNVYELQGS